ncbi:hypothetical protein [Shewanella glacialipiscicola]|uniref:hypothetical protein n=1 Tax=Shewanella glacialipiscicola TaxID=614069 RepID=UPI003D7A9BA9
MICETTVRTMDEAVEHPRMDLLRVGELMPWQAYQSCYQKRLHKKIAINPVSLSLFYYLVMAGFKERLNASNPNNARPHHCWCGNRLLNDFHLS